MQYIAFVTFQLYISGTHHRYDSSKSSTYKVEPTLPSTYIRKTSSVAETAIWAKKIGGKFGLKMA